MRGSKIISDKKLENLWIIAEERFLFWNMKKSLENTFL
jgi:hypothetical protein